MKANEEIRKQIAAKGLKQYELAYKMGISKYSLNTWLQTPLTPEREKRILEALKNE